jgi:hypothetical protein
MIACVAQQDVEKCPITSFKSRLLSTPCVSLATFFIVSPALWRERHERQAVNYQPPASEASAFLVQRTPRQARLKK